MTNNRSSRIKTNDFAEFASMLVFIVGLFMTGVLLMFLLRAQRGLLGIVLAGIATALVIYWIREIKTIVRREFEPIKTSKKWTYDILENNDIITVVAEVPGPTEEVKVELKQRVLVIFGGQKFRKKVSLPKGLRLIDKSHVNGILNVRLSKSRRSLENNSKKDELKFRDS